MKIGHFLRDTTGASIFSLATGAMNFAFNIAASHFMNPVTYGMLSGTLSIITLLLMPTTALTLIVARQSALSGKLVQFDYLQSLRRWFGYSVGLCVLISLVSYLISKFANLPIYLVLLSALVVIPGLGNAISMGVAQGNLQFVKQGLVNFSAATLRLAGLGILVIWRRIDGLAVAVLCTVIAQFFAWLGTHRVVLKATPRGDLPSQHDKGGNGILAVVLTIAGVLFFNFDMLLARHFLNPGDAGLFACLAVAGRIVFLAVGTIPVVFYQYCINTVRTTRQLIPVLTLSAAVIIIVSVGFVLLYWLNPQRTILALFGRQYINAGPYLGLYGAAFGVYGLFSLGMYLLLALNRKTVVLYAILGSVFQVLTLTLFHSSLREFSIAMVSVFFILTTLLSVHISALLVGELRRSRWGELST